jgi:hypothetical protein
MTAKAKAKTKKPKTKKPLTQESPKRQSSGQERETRLDQELAETFPASDPPTVTQPGLIPGGPERKTSSGKRSR